MRWLDSIADSIDVNLSKLQKTVEDKDPGVLQSVKSQRSEHDLAGDSSGKNLPANAGDRRDADSIPR